MTAADILLVEDNPDDEALTLMALQKAVPELRVVVVHDGAEALDYLLGQGAHDGLGNDSMPRVVLLDMNMPRLDGAAVLRELRAREETRLLPVVLLTSCSEDEAIRRGYAAGANSYICKPAKPADYLEIVSQVGLYWMNLNESRIAS